MCFFRELKCALCLQRVRCFCVGKCRLNSLSGIWSENGLFGVQWLWLIAAQRFAICYSRKPRAAFSDQVTLITRSSGSACKHRKQNLENLAVS